MTFIEAIKEAQVKSLETHKSGRNAAVYLKLNDEWQDIHVDFNGVVYSFDEVVGVIEDLVSVCWSTGLIDENN